MIAYFNGRLWSTLSNHCGRPKGGHLSFNKLTKNNMQKFFLYARKSTDVEDKQVRSIEDQITELRALAKKENLEI